MLSELAEKIFKNKYARGDETWEQASMRVAAHVASAELQFPKGEEQFKKYMQLFYDMIVSKKVLPGGRILANAGTGIKNLYSCFVLPIDDTRDSIYKTLHDAANVFAWGGGCGFNFSNLREEGARITTTNGNASGPLSFMELFNTTGEVIQQSSRRGAMMGMLEVDHPDIFKFIKAKSNLNRKHKRVWEEYTNLSGEDDVLLHKVLADNQLSHFNISVILTDDFMNAVKTDGEWNLISRFDGSIKATVRARELFRFIAQNAWESGDPGLYFIDRANEDNFLYPEKIISATNPCGEIGLYDYEPCNLAAINLAAFVEDGKLDVEQLIYYTKIATRFLDNIHDISENLVPEVNENARAYRRLGLGVMGLADMFLKLGIPYDSEDAINLSKGLAKLITESAWEASHDLSEEKGIPKALMGIETDNGSIRNISVTTIAPSGTIALIADVNNAIEPIYSFAYRRNITNGIGNQAIDTAIILNQDLDKHLHEHYTASEIEYIKEKLLESGSLQNIEGVKDYTKKLFKGASDLTWKTHVDIQAAWQESITNSISKTVNLPNNATVEDIEQVFMYAWEQRVKGITIYRDGSKTFQILGKV